MDFLALPRRDLQALCKRNAIRANMTNAAMADALRALPKVEGIEEYVNVLQPVAVPQTAVKLVNQEQTVKKQEKPLPRGRRATAKSSEQIEPEEDKEKLEEDAKRQANKEDAQEPGVGRRGASRRARSVPTVPLPPGKAVAEEEAQENNLKREAKRDNAPAHVVGRRGASRRGRPSAAVASPAAESEVADAEEEQSGEVVVEDLKREATMDDAPALGVGRRARAAPSVAALAGKLVAEEQRALIPRGPRMKAKGTSTEPIKLDDSDDEEKVDAKLEEQEDAQILGVGRRGGASRRAQAAPAVVAPEAMTEEEQRAPVPRGRRVKPKSTELIRVDDSKQEKKDDTKLEEEKGDAPAMGKRGAKRPAPAPSEAAMRRSTAASKDEAGDVAVEHVAIRATRQRKPTMKAAAAAEEKAPRRTTKKGAVTSTLLQQQHVEEEAQGVFSDAEGVGAPVVDVVAVRIRETRHRKPTIEAAAAAAKAEENAPPRDTRRGTVTRIVLQPEVPEKPQEEVNIEDIISCQEEGDVVVDKVLHDLVDNTILLDCSSDISWVEVEKVGNITSKMPDNQAALDEDGDKPNGVVIGDSMSEAIVTDEVVLEEKGVRITDEIPQGIAGMHEMEDDQCKMLHLMPNWIAEPVVFSNAEEVNTEDIISCQEEGDVVVDKVLHDLVDNTILLDCSSDISWIEVEKVGNITSEMPDNQAALDEDGDKPNGVVIGDSMSEAIVTDEVVQEEKGVRITDEIPQGIAGMHEMEDDQFETVFVQADQVVTADNLPEQVTNCEIYVEVNTSLMVDERQQSTVKIDENVVEGRSEIDGVHSNEQIESVTTDKVPELKLIEDVLVQADQVVTYDNLREQVSDCEVTVEESTSVIVDEKQQSTVTMDDDADEQMKVEVPELTGTNVEVIEEKTSPRVDEKQKSTVIMVKNIVDDPFKTDIVHADEQKEVELRNTNDEVVEEMKTPLVVDENKQSTVTDNGDIVDDHFKTHGAHADKQKEVIATEVLEVTGTNNEIEENTPLIVDEKKQSIITVDEDVVFDHLKTDTANADEQKEVIDIVTEVLDEVPGEVIEQKAVVMTEDMPNQGTVPNITNTMDECLKENNVGTDFDHGNEQKKVIITVIEPEVSRAQDRGVRKENALLDDVTESLSKSIITMEPSVCKNSSDKGVKVASEDLSKLSLGQLRAKLKEKLNAKKNKEVKKRVALARVDENVCRSNAKQQNLNLQQH